MPHRPQDQEVIARSNSEIAGVVRPTHIPEAKDGGESIREVIELVQKREVQGTLGDGRFGA